MFTTCFRHKQLHTRTCWQEAVNMNKIGFLYNIGSNNLMIDMDTHNSHLGKLILCTLLPTNFLLSLLIVFHHAFTMDIDYNGSFAVSTYSVSTVFQRYMYNLSGCAVPVFFFISAFLFYRTFDGTCANYKEKMQRRVHSLLIPYLLFCSLGYVKALAFNGEIGRGHFMELHHFPMGE